MQINYEDIITKANARKEALLKLQGMMPVIKDLMGQIEEMRAMSPEILTLVCALDPEGVELLGQSNARALRTLANALAAPYAQLSYVDAAPATFTSGSHRASPTGTRHWDALLRLTSGL